MAPSRPVFPAAPSGFHLARLSFQAIKTPRTGPDPGAFYRDRAAMAACSTCGGQTRGKHAARCQPRLLPEMLRLAGIPRIDNRRRAIWRYDLYTRNAPGETNTLHTARQQLCRALSDSARTKAAKNHGFRRTHTLPDVSASTANVLRAQRSDSAGRNRRGGVQAIASTTAVEVERPGMRWESSHSRIILSLVVGWGEVRGVLRTGVTTRNGRSIPRRCNAACRKNCAIHRVADSLERQESSDTKIL